MNPLVAHITLGVYAALLALGGLMGFVKARSRPSLIAGLVSALGVLAALAISLAGSPLAGRALGLLLAVALAVFFGIRYARRGRKLMPNGLMAVVSLVVVVILAVVLLQGTTPMPPPAP